jgi:hypothetical protein
MIPKEISKENILSAIRLIDREGVPEGRTSRKFLLVFEGKYYPPKYVVALANQFAIGRLLESSLFNGGQETNSFLKRLGFEIKDISSPYLPQEKPRMKDEKPRAIPTIEHNERCPVCKRTIESMLRKIYGEVKPEYRFGAGTLPQDYRKYPFYPALKEIYSRLQEIRGHKDFVRTSYLPECDFYIPNPGFILEFDESQHFNYCRKETLIRYPEELKTGFNVDKWIELCDKKNAQDNNPPYRDEQRAWYDTLRDFLPTLGKLKPTIRLYANDCHWCDLNPELESDCRKFCDKIEGKFANWEITAHYSGRPSLARIVIAGEWNGDVNSSEKLLNDICDKWPIDKHVDCLVTCGAFLNFNWPYSLNKLKDNLNPEKSEVNLLIDEAQSQVDALLSEKIRRKLVRFTDYITIGIDSLKDQVSLSSVSIRKPHTELVVLVDLKRSVYHWTGKSYPTVGQENCLIRFTDLMTHFVQTSFGKVLILGCHDLNLFSPRGEAVTQSEWRKKVRADFYDMTRKAQPDVVLHHPHTTDSSRIWTAAWNELTYSFPSVNRFVSAGRYFRKEGKRSIISDVLRTTKQGDSLDFIVEIME